MKKNFYVSLLALVAALAACASVAVAQESKGQGRTANATQHAHEAARIPLPASDAVMFVDVKRLLNEALPKAFAGDAAKLAQANADIDNFKTRTGLDARAFDHLALGVRYTSPSPDATKIDHVVAVARGKFDAAALVASGKAASQNRHTETKHGGKSVHVFTIEQQVKLFGLFNMKIKDLAMSALDANTLAVGEPEAVRAAIDAHAGRAPQASAELVALASHTPGAIVGFGSQMPRSLASKVEGIGAAMGQVEITRGVAAIRQMYGSVGASAKGLFDVSMVLRTTTDAEARGLGQVVESMKPLAEFGASQMKGDKAKLALSALQSLRVTTKANEVSLNLQLAQMNLASVF